MSDRRLERQRLPRRLLLERAMDRAAVDGRPGLAVLVHEGLCLLWPALYPHARKHAR